MNTPFEKMDHAAKELIKKGFPQKTSAYAAAMGYLREAKKQRNK